MGYIIDNTYWFLDNIHKAGNIFSGEFKDMNTYQILYPNDSAFYNTIILLFDKTVHDVCKY